MKKSIPQLVKDDPWLEPYIHEISDRISRFKNEKSNIEKSHGSLKDFSGAYKYLGINYDNKKGGWWYREWAPAARALALIGDFNDWNRNAHPLTKGSDGIWEVFIPGKDLKHGSRVKVHVVTDKGERDRIPAYIKRSVQDPETHDFSGQVWEPQQKFKWTDGKFTLKEIKESPIIYEAHIGMAQEKEGVGTYVEFAEQVLPRIKDLGYNVVQLMAIQEHPYYGSFGYHVSGFFSPSSRFGTPEELKQLIDTAHKMGIAVIMDLVHSHAVKNISEGLNEFDGSENQYFHAGGRGNHDAWDSKLFDYGKSEVKQFLLSNVRYWLEEYHMDGFRFDGITSMMYFHHGNFEQFDHYDKYFITGVDWDSLSYLQLANDLAHDVKPDCLTIAEDMSGMPGLCRSINDGGVGFDFRLGMGIPDFWIKYLKEKRDEDWNIDELWSVMVNRRWKEKTVAYTESHDQAIVGDKTVAFWLMDKEMYWHMEKNTENPIIDRGIALHKMIRLFTASLGGEAYLNFIGNEFGHPEWIDFPREGNNWSYHYARRQWSLVDNPDLKFHFLNDFDRAMIHLLEKYRVLPSIQGKQINMDAGNQVIIFERANLLFLFNWHSTHSIPDYRFNALGDGNYSIILSSDDKEFGGFSRVNTEIEYPTQKDGRLSVYLPNRTALVMKKVSQ
jgi:1,4-alpha-glucan branching enzyme